MAKRIFLGALLLAAVTWILDTALFAWRDRNGSAHATLVVETSWIIHQKNGKLEYIYDPPQPTACAVALFPHGGEQACWWLSRHTQQAHQITAN